jgi:general secretion pathway protein M
MTVAAVKHWFFSQAPRQQAAMAFSAAVLLVLLLVLLLVPLHASLAALRSEHARAAATLKEVQTLVAAHASLAESTALPDTLLPLIARVNQTLETQGFQPQRIQQGQQGDLQLRVEELEFEALLSWLYELEQTPGVLLDAVSLAEAANGRVSASLTLRSL